MIKSATAIFLFLINCKIISAAIPFQFLAPLPGSTGHNIDRNIIIREGSVLNPQSISDDVFSVYGTKSGNHSFNITLSDDQKTIILQPAHPFAFNEEVSVTINRGLKTSAGKIIDGYSFSFRTHREYTATEIENFRNCKSVLQKQELLRYGVDSASLNQPDDTRDLGDCISIDINSSPSPGVIFFDAVNTSITNSACMGYHIITNDGDSVFSRFNSTPYYDDFKITASGYLSVYNDFDQDIEVLDSNYNVLRKYKPANGYTADNHDFIFLPDGHALLIAEEFQTVDMTVYNPDYSPNATVLGTVIQEFDRSQNLIFEWRSFDHVAITEGLHENLSYSFIDFCHTNSIDIDTDGNIIASHRHLDQVTKIDRNTGEFIWRLGGVMNQFTFINEPEPFTYQHDARKIANGNLTLYDNGDFHTVPRSAAKEYQLDEVNKTATLVWSFAHPDVNNKPVFFFATGSVQRLPNGNTFIDGGYDTIFDDQPNFWEVTPDGTIVWQLTLHETKNIISYRANKFDWLPCSRVTYRLMKTTNITSQSAKLSWGNATNASLYRLQYRVKGTTTWNQVNTSAPIKNIIGLSPNTVYEWRVMTSCNVPDTSSGFTSIKNFKTNPVKSEIEEKDEVSLRLNPNPAADKVNILLANIINENSLVKIFNLLGQEVYEMKFPDGSNTFEISLAGFEKGNYLVEVVNGEENLISKLVVE